MKEFERMKRMKKNYGMVRMAALTIACLGFAGTAHAATGTSAEFKVDLKGMGPWEMRTAAASEAIAYSSAWATNALSGANAVVKVCPAKRNKPKYIAIDLSGGTTATHYPIEYLDEIPGGAWSDEYKTSKLVLRHIPAGSFIMGGRNTDYPGERDSYSFTGVLPSRGDNRYPAERVRNDREHGVCGQCSPERCDPRTGHID